MNRGTTDGADCVSCPFSVFGQPNKPVLSEYPDDPLWVVIGESPGFNEARLNKPFCGSQGLLDKMLTRIGQPRDDIFTGYAVLCIPSLNSSPEDRERAASACSKRLHGELAQFPGKPVLTLGAIAARAVIPRADLEAIDPPDVPKGKKRAAKDKQAADWKEQKAIEKSISKITDRRMTKAIKHFENELYREAKRVHHAKPNRAYVLREIGRVRGQIRKKCHADAILEYQAKKAEALLNKKAKPAKEKKKKPIKITDIMGSTFEVDVDGTGKRVVIPTIHPASLLRGGGAMIGGTHAPDLAWINLTYDAGKVRALALKKDIWLRFDSIETEYVDSARAVELFLRVFWKAIDEGQVAIDLETYVDDPDRHHALMAYKANVRALGLATSDCAVSVLWDLLPSWTQSYLQLLLVQVKIIAQNALYDRTVLRAYGFILNEIWDDTLLAHAAAFPGVAHGLQHITSQLFACTPWKAEFRNAEESPDKLTAYNAKDTYSTLKIFAPLEILVRRNKAEQSYARDQKMSEIASRMHIDGMPVSREVNAEMVAKFSALTKETRASVEEKASDPEVRKLVLHHLAIMQASKKRKADSPEFEERYEVRLSKLLEEKWRWKISSSKHIAALLLALGVNLNVKTDGGEISTKKEILESLVDVGIVRDLLRFREADKALNTFFWPTFDREVNGQIVKHGYADENDRVHPIWSLPKISGRWSSWDPVVSNPLKDIWRMVDGKNVLARPSSKRQFVARKGRKLVGFDFCFAKGTLVDTPNGPTPIDQLRVGDLVFSFNFETKRPACSRVTNQVCTGMRETIVVTLDNGERVRCTPEHRWFVRPWGSGAANVVEVQAKDLKPGMRLLPLRRSSAGSKGNEYETLYSYSALQYTKTHLAVAEAAYGPRPDGYHAHHKNEDRFDNRASNLEYKLANEHLSKHSTMAALEQWKNPEIREKMRDGISRSIAERGGYHGENNPNFGKRTGTLQTCPNCDKPTYFGGKNPKVFCCRACYHEFRRKSPKKRNEKYIDRNHKVLAVEHDGLVVETYDIEVERDHNFALAAGVFVHNCQLEARIIALISGDPFLLHVFASGGDIHTECARVVFDGQRGSVSFDAAGDGSPRSKAQKRMRDVTKNLEYGAMYGGADETLWKTLLKEGFDVKLADVSLSVAKLKAKMAGVIAWQADTVRRASQPPYTLRDYVDGRMRIWPMGQVDMNEALNIVPQATGAAIMNTGMERMDARIMKYKQVFPIVQVHDAAVYECWEDDAEAVQKDMDEVFPQEYERNGVIVPFPIESAIGDCWIDV